MFEPISSLKREIGALSNDLGYAVQVIVGGSQDIGTAQQRFGDLLADIDPEAEPLTR